MMKHEEHKHVELAAMGCLKADQFGIPQFAEMVQWVAPWGLLRQCPMTSSGGLEILFVTPAQYSCFVKI